MSWVELNAETAAELAERHGTPFYFYDLEVLLQRARRAKAALPANVLYAMKANPHVELLRGLHGVVDGLDVSSLGEVERALACGWKGSQLSFAGPGKTPHELEQAVGHGVLISVESIRELDALGALGRAARIRLRLNLATRAQAYRVPMMGGPSPFGIDEEELAAAMARLGAHPQLELEGVHVHPGAQCTSVGGFATAVAATLDLVERLGVPVQRVNFGGGFGVVSPDEELEVEAAGRRLGAMLEKFRAATGKSLEAVLELGRWLVAPAGLYVARVVSEKRSRGTHFTILDGGMNHHLGATGHVSPRLALVNLSRPEAPKVTRTVVGPLCTPLDTLGVEVELPEPRVGDLIGVVGSGAYGYSFSPLHFLGHPLPAELVASGLGAGRHQP